jgi:hypothetical protein
VQVRLGGAYKRRKRARRGLQTGGRACEERTRPKTVRKGKGAFYRLYRLYRLSK